MRGGRREVGGGRWEVGGGRWEVRGGRWEVGRGRLVPQTGGQFMACKCHQFKTHPKRDNVSCAQLATPLSQDAIYAYQFARRASL